MDATVSIPSWLAYGLTTDEQSMMPAIVQAEARAALCGVDRVLSLAYGLKDYRDFLQKQAWLAVRRAKAGAS